MVDERCEGMPVDEVCERLRQRGGQAETPELLYAPCADETPLTGSRVKLHGCGHNRSHALEDALPRPGPASRAALIQTPG